MSPTTVQEQRERILLARALRVARQELGIPISAELEELADRKLPARVQPA